MQIQEGVLGKGGVISSASWVPVVSYQITDRNVREDVDYHTLTWLDRAIDLDDLETDKMHEVLTGIRFGMLGTHLNFQIRLTAFDFDSGELQPEKSYWKSNHNTDGANVNPRRKIDMQGLDIPTRSPPSSKPNHESNMYLEFTNTDFAADVAQTTIPFFDSQEVYSDIPVPLAGAGIYYKRIANYGGFVAPKIITFNYHGILEEAIYDLNPDEIQVV
ncbi:uncharacterized protein [Atheta coriaria]|uniref:uncharacterized protein n=1 Tax=Dalotia coriaria TaxID=877792 RepID=UPI0031F45914